MKPFIEKRHLCFCLTQLFAWSVGIFLMCTLPAYAQKTDSCPPIFVLPERNYDLKFDEWNEACGDTSNFVSSPQSALQELARADVVYLGETHARLEDHQTQLEILQKLQQRSPKIAIAMEMFQRPYQSVLNRYLAGELSEQELVEQSEYETRWAFPWEYYAPILRFAKEKQLPVLALNTPTEVTRKVAREGLDSLTPTERQFIPPFSEIRTDDGEYRRMALIAFQQHKAVGHGYSASFERFFLAQVLWDETMAEGVTKFFRANPDYQVVVLAGKGHIAHGYGIPSRVARRLNDRRLIQRSVLLSPRDRTPPEIDRSVADFVWQR